MATGAFLFGNQASPDDSLLKRQLNPGEAVIWYLGHSGWAVKTRDHFLIFDYTQRRDMPKNPSLSTGHVLPFQIKDQNVYVFVTHAHGDHFDQDIWAWEETVDRITYVFGWQADGGTNSVNLDSEREEVSLNGLKVMTVHHDFDGIPEAAFLVDVDGLVIFFSGDHGSTGEILNPVFKDNMDFLASRVRKVDIAFISQFGNRTGGEVNKGDLYTFDVLKPRVAFPMHQGGGERFYMLFAQEAQEKGVKIRIIPAEKMGDHFIYRRGEIIRQDDQEAQRPGVEKSPGEMN